MMKKDAIKAKVMKQLTAEFWRAYKGMVVVCSDGRVAFTRNGRVALGPQMARHGIAISRVRTLPELREMMSMIARDALEQNNARLREMLRDPRLTAEERLAIQKVLAIG